MITHYRDMASDEVRINIFRRAIEAVVKPGDVVADIGCGLGTYAIFACRAGAGRVFAVERENVILVAKQIAEENRCADRIEFIRGDAASVTFPEPADVLITEALAVTFVDPDTERLLAHARRHLLKPSGCLIPAAVSVRAAPVSCPQLYRRIDPWADEQTAYGIDFSAVREPVMNTVHKVGLRAAHLVGKPKELHRGDLAAGGEFAFDAGVRWRARKKATVHGLAVWFEAQLARRVRLSNAPGAPPTLWGQGFLPLSEPLAVKKNGAIAADVAARMGPGGERAWWQWEVSAAGRSSDGTTFRSFPTSPADLAAGSRGARPGLSTEGRITACILRSLASGCTISEAAGRLRREFPDRFPTVRSALARAGAAARRFGRRPE
ncbi:MAG: methyltransferase domain-containing protein [Planctomycetota bacterium]